VKPRWLYLRDTVDHFANTTHVEIHRVDMDRTDLQLFLGSDLTLSPSGYMMVQWSKRRVILLRDAWRRIEEKDFYAEMIHEIVHALWPTPPEQTNEVGRFLGLEYLLHKEARTLPRLFRWLRAFYIGDEHLIDAGVTPSHGREFPELDATSKRKFLRYCVKGLHDFSRPPVNLEEMREWSPTLEEREAFLSLSNPHRLLDERLVLC